jgi:hypothetical protein
MISGPDSAVWDQSVRCEGMRLHGVVGEEELVEVGLLAADELCPA